MGGCNVREIVIVHVRIERDAMFDKILVIPGTRKRRKDKEIQKGLARLEILL